MLLRSFFYLLRVKSHIKPIEFYILLLVLIIGISLTSYNITDPIYVLQRFPFNEMFLLGSAWAFLLLTRARKKDLFNITNVIREEYTKEEDCIIKKMSRKVSPEPEEVSIEDLNTLEIGKPYITSSKTLIISLRPPKNKGILFKFSANMLKDGEFTPQLHSEMDKEIYVDFGSITTNEHRDVIYKEGDVLSIPAGEIHSIIALERSKLSAYLYKKDITISHKTKKHGSTDA